MKIRNQLPITRLIGKIDNDFNISDSDWIPRVAAWTIDALSQMQVLPMERKRKTLDVFEKVAIYPCKINAKDLKVFDINGYEIPNIGDIHNNCSGFVSKTTNPEIGIFDARCRHTMPDVRIAEIVNIGNRNYILDGNKIELNFDAKQIVVESYEVATYYDDYYDCECPYIYDNGLLLEALAWYCLFKYLSRGGSHPVYSLKGNNAVTNPYIQWNNLRPKAMAAVKIEINKANSGWNNFFYNSTFLPRS